MKQKIIAYFLLISGLFTFFFFYNYRGSLIQHNTIFWIIGLFFFVSGFYILKNESKIIMFYRNREQKKILSNLVKHGNRIIVDLRKCEIKSNSFLNAEVEDEKDEVSFIRFFADPGILKSISSIDYFLNNYDNGKQKNYSVIIFRSTYLGEKRMFISQLIEKDKITLSIKMNLQKEINLYIDKQDKNLYAYDLTFLES